MNFYFDESGDFRLDDDGVQRVGIIAGITIPESSEANAFAKIDEFVATLSQSAFNMNAFVARWIQSLKHEALNYFVVLSLEHFDHIVSEFVDYYHECRPHQGIGNRLIGAKEDDDPEPVISMDQVCCETRLGGLLKHYYRAA
jgi:hypothetical protein